MKLNFAIPFGCLYAATFFVMTSARADTPAFTSGGSTSNQPPSFTGTKGWSFYNYNPNGAFLITQLGVFDSGGDGLDNPHQVGLWTFNGTLLASATVPAGSLAPLYDGYRYVPISPVPIPRASSDFDTSTAFKIAGQYALNDTDDLVTPFSIGTAPGIAAFSGIFFHLAGMAMDQTSLSRINIQSLGVKASPGPHFER